MRKLIINLLVFMLLCINGVMAQFSGAGTESDPYRITSEQDLLTLVNTVNAGVPFSGKFFQQTADIDLVDSQIFPNGFTPIGGFDGNKPFSGTYDGGGHSIFKMVINGSDKVAMFTNLQNGCIKNLNLENLNINVNGYSIVSGLVASASNSTISNVTVSGLMSASGEMTELHFAGMVGQATCTSISGSLCMLSVDVSNAQFNSTEVAGIAKADSRTTVANCFVSTFVRGVCSTLYPIVDKGTATKCLVAESNVMATMTEDVTYNDCYFDHQNTLIVEFPIQESFIDGFYAKPTSLLVSGSLFNDDNWVETAGLYPRPAAIANTNAAILAATPMTLNSADGIGAVRSDFTVSTANGVNWDSESSYLQVSGNNVSLQVRPDSLAEIYAYRNNLVKNLGVYILGDRLGSKGNPLRISNENDLQALSRLFGGDEDPWDGYSKGMADYDWNTLISQLDDDIYILVDSDITVTGPYWTPIGGYGYSSEYSSFTGHFDGGNHTITFADSLEVDYGNGILFGYVGNSTISNITVVCENLGMGTCGGAGLIGEVYNSVISNATIKGNLAFYMGGECYSYYGGIAGIANSTSFINCVNEASIYSSNSVFGGIVGQGEDLILRSCVNTGTLVGSSGYSNTYIAGIIGEVTNSSIINCANYGSFADAPNVYTIPCAIVGSVQSSEIYGCANYGDNIIPLAIDANDCEFSNNINVPNNICSQPYDAEIISLILMNSTGSDSDNSLNYFFDNYTDKQLAPFAGNTYGIKGILTNDLISGNADELSADDWVFTSGRYPMPIGTDLDNDIVKLATTPIFLAATNDESYQTVKSVYGNIILPSTNGISWTLDSIPLAGTSVNLDSLRTETESVSLTLYSHIGENSKPYNIILSPMLGTPDNPLLVESLSDFNELAQAVAAQYDAYTYKGMVINDGGAGLYFRLTADIEAEQGSTNVVQISQMNGFSGNFNGGGHTITVTNNDLYQNSVCGLFTSISYARIDSLNVALSGNASAPRGTNASYASILCTNAINSTISNCTVVITDGTFSSYINCGLICGLLQNSRLIGCSTQGNGNYTIQSGDYAGGLVACSKNSTISNCTNGMSLYSQVGCVSAGIVSRAYSLILENCTNNAEIMNSQAAYLTYTAGIVGKLDDNYSPEYNSITNAVNNGRIYANNNSRGVAAGIICGYNTSSGNASVKVKNCVNSGYIYGGDAAAGIAYHIKGEVSNCANYGIVESTGDVAAIKCLQGSSSSVGNIEVGMVINEYNYYNDYTESLISPDADEDDFFDSEITDIRVDSLRINFNNGGTPRTTRQMVGSALANELPGDWDFAENLYPLPAGIDPNDPRNKLARMPIILRSEGLSRCEYMTSVLSDIILPQVEGVTWESSNPNIVSAPSGGGVATVTNPQADSTVRITATCEGFTKSYTFTVHRARGSSADDPIIISSSDDFEELGTDYPSYCYGLYFRLGNSIEISGSLSSFNGHFDGGGYTITWGNNVNRKCLFRNTTGAEISNLSTCGSNTALIDNAKETTIRNCAVYTNISSAENAGGLVGESSDGTLIDGCIVAGNIVTKHSGGFVSNAKDTRIVNSISMISANNSTGAEQEDVAAFVYSGYNNVVDSCLIIGSYLQDIPTSVCPSIGNEGSSIYYDNQQWNFSDDNNSLPAIGKMTRELVGNGIFAGSANWVHADDKYPVPAGTEDFLLATLVSTPMLIGENDRNVMEVTSLGISPEQVEGEVQWSAQSDSGVTADLTVACVDSPLPAEIVATLTDTSTTYIFTRPIMVTKGMLSVDNSNNSDPLPLCEGENITVINPFYGDAEYQWSSEPELQINEFGTDSVAVSIPIDYLATNYGNSQFVVTITAMFEGCEKTYDFRYNILPSATHIRLNDTAICVGSEVTLSCYADEGYEDYIDGFDYQWSDSEYDENIVLGEGPSYYIPSMNADRTVTVGVTGCSATIITAQLSAIDVVPITIVSGEPNQSICQGEFMEPVVFSVERPTYYLPEGIYADYNDDEALLTLSGRPFYNSQYDYSYTIYGCGSTYSGSIDVSKRTRIHTDGSFSQVLNLGDELDDIRLEDTGWEYYITVESLDGTETFTTEDLGLYISNIDRIDFLSGTPQMPGEFIYHITIPENGACPVIVYDNFLGVYDTEDLSATALSTTLCVGETATLTTVERPGAYGGEYVWTLEEDTVGTGSRINVIPPLGTSTYEVACGGKRMYGEFEIGDYVYLDEQLGENAYSMRKNTEISVYDYQTGYMIANVEQDSLLLMSLSKLEEIVWSYDTIDVSGNTNYATVADAMNDMNGRRNSMLLADDETSAAAILDDEDMYLPSAGELGYILNNYDKFYFALEYDLPIMLSSTEKDANTVYVFNVNYGRMMEYPKTEIATAMGFKKIAKSDVVNMVGRTSNINRTGSIDIIVSDRHEMSISTDDVLCNTDTAHVAIETEYSVVDWYNTINSDEQVVVENGVAVLPEGSYIAVGTDEYGSCHDTLEVKVKDLAFYMPQDTTVCDSVSFTIAKEDVTVMLGDEVLEGQTFMIAESGIYNITLIGVGDTCREEKTINVTVNQSYSISFDTIVLDSEFVWNGETYTATGDYEQRFTSVSGCDSVVTVHLTIANTETEFAVYGNVAESDGVSRLSGVNVVSGGASTVTDEAGYYVIMVQRANPILQFAKPGYNFVCDTIAESGQHNVLMLKPEMSVSLSDDSYETNPYVMRQFTVQLSNTGDGPMAWSSLVETEQTRNVMHSRNNTTMWEYADTVIRTYNNAEQAIATDGYYIYTASWQRAGEFSRYSIDNGYLETFIIEGVGGIRNMTYGNGFFFATDNTNKIYKINMDSQSLEDVITLNDPDLQIRYCAYSTAEDLLYIGNWTNLYKLVAYNTAYPTLIPLSYTMDNVYSIAYDAFSGTTPCLWAFSQVSENNGPFAKIYKLNTNGVQVEGMVHYINDASLATASSLAGGICVSQYLYDDRYVLLANVQNTNATNNIAVYELGRKNSWVSTDVKGGVIPVGGSIDVTVTEYAVENGNYTANVKFKPVVCMPEVTEVGLSMAVSTPQCSPVANLVAETDTFHTVNLSWEAAELGDYESVSYLIYEEGTAMPIDTVDATTYTISNPEVGNHCYYVRAFMRGEADCVSEASNTACVEILEFPCNVQLSLTARAYGNRIRLEWTELYGVSYYAILSLDGSDAVSVSGDVSSFEVDGVNVETDYCYRVMAFFRNNECNSVSSNDACARIASAGCGELPVAAAKAVGNSVAVTWTRVGGVQSYSLYRDDKYLTSTSDTIFYDMMLDFETEYCYVVEIDCGYGNYGLSETACATTDAEVIEENAVELLDADNFELYPNPAAEMFFVEGRQMQGLQIVNFAGQVVYELDNISDDRLPIDVSGFAPGVYAVRIILSDSRSVVKRIVIGR
ncbi:MAG: T9SS type A sorting domain-containing protein [Bacteroidales bacterium]|nr:T9SS type A sorting domain-containing protein [Bacteroidales bacterium]